MALPVYSSKDVKINWVGAPLTGLAPDTFVTFSYNSDNTDEKIGADGSVEISLNPDRSGTCTLTFLQESFTNAVLGGVQSAIKGGGFLPQGTLTIADPSGSVLAILRGAHIKTAPEIVMGATTQERAWTFFVEDLWFAATTKEVAKTITDADADRIVGLIDTIANSRLI